MDKRLSLLVDDYLSSVASAVRLLEESGIARPQSNTAWACNGIAQSGVLGRGVKYFKHGYGCAVHLEGGTVDFDFGADGETNGFDAWRLSNFAGRRLARYGFASETELEACFRAAVEAGSFISSGYNLHYRREDVA